jgi:2-dehydropantoate 2-reductase
LKILIIGAGAIGSLVGGKLAQSGNRVTLVGRPRFVEAVRAQGLRIHQGDQTHVVTTLDVVPSLHDAAVLAVEHLDPYDLAILTVKGYDSGAALEELSLALNDNSLPTPLVLSLQNGVGNEDAIATLFGSRQTLAGTITAPVETPEPGLIHVTKPTFVIGLARWSAEQSDADVSAVQRLLEGAGIRVTVYADARSMKWTKLLMNMIGNATSAILAEPPAQTFADPGIANIEIAALREALAVMAAAEIAPVNVEKYPMGSAAPLLRYAPKFVLRPVLRQIVGGARGGKMPSLFLDLERGKTDNEVDLYNGAIVRQGERNGVPTPVNRALTAIVQELARNPAARAEWRGNHQRLIRQCTASS